MKRTCSILSHYQYMDQCMCLLMEARGNIEVVLCNRTVNVLLLDNYLCTLQSISDDLHKTEGQRTQSECPSTLPFSFSFFSLFSMSR
jgi:hypothetical protein